MKILKLFLWYFLYLILMLNSVNANSYVKYCFFDTNLGVTATNINVRGYICSENQCSNPIGEMWDGRIVNSNEIIPHDCVVWEYPTTLQGQSYTLVYYGDGYKTSIQSQITTTDANNPGTSVTSPLIYPWNPIPMDTQ